MHPLYGTPMDLGSHDRCRRPGHVCVLCEYPKWYATLDRAGRQAEAARIRELRVGAVVRRRVVVSSVRW